MIKPIDHDVDPAGALAKLYWPIAVDAETAARLFGLSARAWWRLHSSGRCPMPIRCGRSVRWRVDELRRWCEAGCPPREKWQALRDTTTDT